MATLDVRLPDDIPASIPEHAGRNEAMFRVACAGRAQGLGGDALAALVETENRARCRPPLPEHELASIVKSAERYPLGEQRQDNAGATWQPSMARRRPETPREPEPWRTIEPPSDAWQARARAFCEYAHAQLWGDATALAYLHNRGLTEDTIREAQLGWNPREWRDAAARWGQDGKPVWLAPGWVIPNEGSGVLWGVNIRRPGDAEPKYMMVSGSKRRVYGLGLVGHHSDLVICEGEFDALLVRQEVGAVVAAVALGGANNRPDVDSLRVLAGFRRWWVATDQDDAGRKAQAELLEATQRARPLDIPRADCKDVTDLWRAGVDLTAWIVGAVGPADPAGCARWAEHYMETLDAQGLGKDPATCPELRTWLALLERYNAVCGLDEGATAWAS